MLMLSISGAHAEMLVPHAIMCDSKEDLKVLEMVNLKGQPGPRYSSELKAGLNSMINT